MQPVAILSAMFCVVCSFCKCVSDAPLSHYIRSRMPTTTYKYITSTPQGRPLGGGFGGHIPPNFWIGGDIVLNCPPNFWNQAFFTEL